MKITSKEELIDLMATLNNTSVSWGLKDYLKLWAQANPEYKLLAKKIDRYDLSITDAIKIYTNQDSSRLFKKGDLKIVDEKRSDYLSECIVELKRVLPTFRRVSQACFKLVSLENYDHNVMMTKLKNRQITFTEDKVDVIFNTLLYVYDN